MTDAVSGAMMVAQVIKRIMDLLAQRAANFEAIDDLRKRMNGIQRVCDQIQALEATVGRDKIDLSFATDGVLDALTRVEEYVQARLAERGKGGGAKGLLRKLNSVLSADGIASELERLDVTLNRHLQVLSVAQGGAQLARQVALEAQIERLTKMSENMFALQMMAASMATTPTPAARPVPRAMPVTPRRPRPTPAPVATAGSDDAEHDDEEEEEPQPVDEVPLALAAGVEKRLVHSVQDVEATGPRRARVYVDDPPEASQMRWRRGAATKTLCTRWRWLRRQWQLQGVLDP